MNRFKIIFLVSVAVFAMSCNKKELKQAQQQNAVLLEEAQEKEKALEELLNTVNVIEEDLAKINKLELSITSQDSETPTKPQKERIKDNIEMINTLLIENNKKIEAMTKELENGKYKNSALRKLIVRLKEENAKKAKTIIELNDKISKLNIEIRGMQGEIYELAETVDAMSQKNIETAGELKDRQNQLNEVYYTVGTMKLLQERNIITRSGGFIGIGKTSTLNGNFDIDAFTKVDKREVTFIKVETKKLSVITSHPEGSYEIVGEDGDYEGIRITDADSFWKANKFLVIAVK